MARIGDDVPLGISEKMSEADVEANIGFVPQSERLVLQFAGYQYVPITIGSPFQASGFR